MANIEVKKTKLTQSEVIDDLALTESGKLPSALAVSNALSEKLGANSIVDDLNSTLSTVPLSANQGRILKEKLEEAQSASSVDNHILVTRNISQSMGTTAGGQWQPNLELYKSGDLVLSGGRITLYAGRTYEITFQLAPSLSTSTNAWVSYVIHNYTNNVSPTNQIAASYWLSTSPTNVGNPVGRAIITVAASDIEIGVRNHFTSGTAHTLLASGNNLGNDGGDCFLEVKELSQIKITDTRINQQTLSGVYADHIHATINGNWQLPASQLLDVPFNLNLSAFGDVINQNGLFTLKAGRTYRLESSLSAIISSTDHRIVYEWVDENDTPLDGTRGFAYSVTATTAFAPVNSAVCVITPLVDIRVKVKVVFSNTGATQTVYGKSVSTSVSMSYALIQQIGASEIITNVINTGEGDPKNFVTRDTTNNYDPTKHLVDFYFHDYPTQLDASDVALRCGNTDPEKRARFWFLLQKLGSVIGGYDNDTFYDGVFSGVHIETNKQSNLNDSGMFNKSTYTGSSRGDVDPHSQNDSPGDVFKLVLGVDSAGNIWFVPVAVFFLQNATTGSNAIVTGIKFYNDNNTWVIAGSGGVPALYTTTGFVSGGTPTFNNNILNANFPAIQYLPHRLELQ